MIVKLFEVRDRGTLIPAIGIEMAPSGLRENHGSVVPTPEDIEKHEAERWLLRHSGFGFEYPLILFGRLEGRDFHYDPYSWSSNPRTMRAAHIYIADNWKELKSGDLIDVEFILNEKPTKKVTERV